MRNTDTYGATRSLSRRGLLRLAAGAGAGAILAACGGDEIAATATRAAINPAGAATAVATNVSGAATVAATVAGSAVAPAATAAVGAASAAVATARPATTGSAVTGATTAPAATTATTGAAATVAPAAMAGATANLAVSKSGFKGTLQYWILGYQANGGNATGKLTDAAVAAFTKANPDIKVETTGYTGDQAGFTKLTQAVQGGGSVDIFRLPSDILPLLVADGLVAPIDDFLSTDDRADLIASVFDATKIGGKGYAWPLWVPPVGMFLNTDIFKEKGVALPGPTWTYDQFVEAAKQLTFQRGNGERVYGYTGAIDPGLVNTWPFILNDGVLPLAADNSKYTFNTPEGISGLQKLVDLAQKHKVTPPDFATQTTQDVLTSFGDKKLVAMYSHPSGDAASLRAAKANFEVRPMPTGKTGKPGTAGGIGLISVAQNAKDKAKLTAAMDFGRYLTSAQVGKDVEGYYLAPGARKSVTVSDPIDKFTPLVPDCYITPIIAEWPQIRTIIHPNIQNAVFGKSSAEQAMNAPANEINGILANRKK